MPAAKNRAMVVNWRWPCRTAALALVVCWQVPAHVMHGPRAVKKRYTGETGIAINWRDGPVTDPTLKLLEGMQQLQQQQELYKIWVMGFHSSPFCSARHFSSEALFASRFLRTQMMGLRMWRQACCQLIMQRWYQ